MVETYIGQIALFAGNFAPTGWTFCHGQELPITGHQALFTIIGTTYGGNGRTTFALPDLRGHVVAGSGKGEGREGLVTGRPFSWVGVNGPVPPDEDVGESPRIPCLPLNYIIALVGVFPPRGDAEPAVPTEGEPRYRVVIDQEEMYSIWPTDREIPAGWKEEGMSGSRSACLEHIAQIWTDMRPLSVRRMEEEDRE